MDELKGSQKICLAVSRIKACWDTDRELVFVGDGVLDFQDEAWAEAQGYKVLSGPWNELEYEVNGLCFVRDRVERYRVELARILNDLHGVEYEDRYWGIILDAWLFHFVSVVHDRVNKLSHAHAALKGAYINALQDSILPCDDVWAFIAKSREDEFNQYIYVEAARVLGVDVVEKPAGFPPESGQGRLYVVSNKNPVKTFFVKSLKLVVAAWANLIKPILILDGCFSIQDSIFIMLRSLGRVFIVPSRLLFVDQCVPGIDVTWRSVLKVDERDRYDSVANRLLLTCFPKSFLEGYKLNNKQVVTFMELSGVGSATGFYSNDAYKLLAAELSLRGRVILGFQHGGGYGVLRYRLEDDYERRHVDRWYAWESKDGLPATKLRKLRVYRRAGNDRSRTGILFVATDNYRYIHRRNVRDNADCMLSMMSDQYRLYEALEPQVRCDYLLRPYPHDSGWRYKERWINRYGKAIKFDTNVSYYDSLAECRIYVTDHISTTWLEAFYMGTPVVLYFDCERYYMQDEALYIFSELRSAGVLHDTPEEAASHISKVYKNVERWWASPGTVQAVDRCRRYFIGTSGAFVKDWTDELLSWRKCE